MNGLGRIIDASIKCFQCIRGMIEDEAIDEIVDEIGEDFNLDF